MDNPQENKDLIKAREEYDKETTRTHDFIYSGSGRLFKSTILEEISLAQAELLSATDWQNVLRLQGKVNGLMNYYNKLLYRAKEQEDKQEELKNA